MIQNSAYVTEAKEKNYSQKMDVYINSLQKKIATAKWKQTLVLNYNYMPLEMIKEKIVQQSKAYSKKLQNLQIKLTKQTQSIELLQQVDTFKDFSLKLQSKIKEIQQNIQLMNMNISVLIATVNEKKNSLMQLMRQNANFNKFIISQKNKQNATSQTNFKQSRRQIKAISNYKLDQSKTINMKTQRKEQLKQTSLQNSQMKQKRNISSNNQIYEECVQALVKSLRSMNATDDVQTGIYLQIMNRKIPTKAPMFSLKSKTCDVLMDRFKDLRLKNKDKLEEDFSMRLDTFLGLNWKQIMGIVLVKDRKAIKLKKLLKSSEVLL